MFMQIKFILFPIFISILGLVWIFLLLQLIIHWVITFLNRAIVYIWVQVVMRIIYRVYFGFLKHWCYISVSWFFPHIFNFRFSRFRSNIYLLKLLNNLISIGIWWLYSFLLKPIILACFLCWSINFNLNRFLIITINFFHSRYCFIKHDSPFSRRSVHIYSIPNYILNFFWLNLKV